MELQAAIAALEFVKENHHPVNDQKIDLYTDSKYVINGITTWIHNWKQNGWKRKEKSKLVPVKNEDLWRQLDELLLKHAVTYTRVAGHSGHPENERCDELAVAAYREL